MFKTLRLILTTLVLAALLPSAGWAEKISWNFNIHGPSRSWTRGMEVAKRMLEKASDGQFQLRLVYAAALGPSKQNLESIKVGALEAGINCALWAPSRVPLQTVLELPFILPTDLETVQNVQHAVFNHPAVVKELASRWNAMYFLNAPLPVYEMMGRKRVATVDDLKGVRIRAGGETGKVLSAYGAVITMIPVVDFYQSLEKGIIDEITQPYYVFGVYKLYEVSKYLTSGLALGPGACATMVSRDAWAKLPNKLKAMMPEVRKQAMAEQFAAYEAADKKYLPLFKKRGIELVQFPTAERQKLIAKSKAIWKAWAKRMDSEGRPGSELLDFTQAQVAKFSK